MCEILFVVGMAGIGWVMPEFAAAIGSGKIRVPVGVNVISAVSMSFIGCYIAFG